MQRTDVVATDGRCCDGHCFALSRVLMEEVLSAQMSVIVAAAATMDCVYVGKLHTHVDEIRHVSCLHHISYLSINKRAWLVGFLFFLLFLFRQRCAGATFMRSQTSRARKRCGRRSILHQVPHFSPNRVYPTTFTSPLPSPSPSPSPSAIMIPLEEKIYIR
jgi:hypothetical protein